jgi:DNA-binding response OmpR family regulator
MATILLVDDDCGARESLSALLRLDGHETVTAETGRAGISRASSSAFDVILVDLRLPDVSGLEVVRELKSRGLTTPMVIVTAFPTLESSFDASTVGAAGFVDRPLVGDEVCQVVRQALEGRFPVRHPDRLDSPDADHRPHAATLPGGKPSRVDPRIRHILQVIEADPKAAASVKVLAAFEGLSESRLRHLFMAYVGVPISRFAMDRRLQHGARRLTTTSDPVSKIAFALGWASAGRFRRLFRHKFKMPPAAYRARFSRQKRG